VLFEMVEGAVWTLAGYGIGEQPPSKTSLAINAAFNKVLSKTDWLAAQLPCDRTGFSRFYFGEDSPWFESLRGFNTKPPYGVAHLRIDSVEAARMQRKRALEFREGHDQPLAEGVEPGSSDLARSWHVFTFQWMAQRQLYSDLIGLCFHDGAQVRIEFRGWATKEQAAAFQILIAESSARLAALCETELRPYLDRAESSSTPKR
jgi:hypothetical protein